MKSKQVPSRMKVKAIGDSPRSELTSRLSIQAPVARKDTHPFLIPPGSLALQCNS